MTADEKKQYEAFNYYYETNTEKGISYITDYMCKNILNLEEIKDNYIPKDKIRDKLDEIMSYKITSIEERHQQNYAYDRIRELLEEE